MFSYNPNESNLRKASELARSQIGIWEKLLALRVSSQRVIDLANKLPPISQEFIVENLVEKNKENDLEAVYQSLISGLLGMNSTLIESLDVQNEESTHKETTDPDALWDQIEGLTNRFEDKWATILNRWHSKINFGSEKLKNKLKVFNVSLMSQVDDLILDDKRNLDKSRIPIYESERVGIESFVKQLEENPDALEKELLETHGIYVEKKLEIDDSMLSASLLKQQKNQQKKRKMFDLEVYDDRPFYSQLLNVCLFYLLIYLFLFYLSPFVCLFVYLVRRLFHHMQMLLNPQLHT